MCFKSAQNLTFHFKAQGDFISSHTLAKQPLIVLCVLSFIWGYNWVVMKGAMSDISPLWFGATRTLIPALLLLLMLPLLKKRFRPPPLSFVLPLGLLQTAGYVGFTMLALEEGTASGTAILVFTMPIWLTLMAHGFLHERLTRRHWMAIGLAGMGLFLMIAPWQTHLALASSLFALLSGITWAGGSLWQKKVGHLHKLDMVNVTAWQMLLGGLVLLLAALLFEELRVNWTPHLAWVLFYNLIPVGAIGWLMWFYVLQNLPTKIAGFGSLFTPTIGILAAWLQLGEEPETPELFGILFILTALVLILWPSKLKMNN